MVNSLLTRSQMIMLYVSAVFTLCPAAQSGQKKKSSNVLKLISPVALNQEPLRVKCKVCYFNVVNKFE